MRSRAQLIVTVFSMFAFFSVGPLSAPRHREAVAEERLDLPTARVYADAATEELTRNTDRLELTWTSLEARFASYENAGQSSRRETSNSGGAETPAQSKRQSSRDLLSDWAGELNETCPSQHRSSPESFSRQSGAWPGGPNPTRHAQSLRRVAHSMPVGRETAPIRRTNVELEVIENLEPKNNEPIQYAIDQAHAACFDGDPFPSAVKCQQCHPGHYREWSVSPHAYAQLSPVFNAMSSTLNILTNGTTGDFCIRCHTPVGMALDEPIVMSNMDRPPSSREGVTCVVCHRINQAWGKGAGRQALVPGDINSPIYGPLGSDVLEEVLADPERYGVLKADADQSGRGRPIHRESIPFFTLTTSSFCAACHDVFAPNGFRLEDAFSEFKSSPAAVHKKQSCQDCHMGVQHGVASGYRHEPAAKVGNVYTRPRKRTNHMMVGPDYSIIHPGLFPHNPEAVKEEHAQYRHGHDEGLATMREWLLFDHKAGWGTPQFEYGDIGDYVFPDAWIDQARRFRARDILNEQFKLLGEAELARHQILSTGYQMSDIELVKVDRRGIKFQIPVYNGTDGHGVPTGFDAERVVFLRVTVVDRNGRPVFISGDLDPNGDVRDNHSLYVHNGELPQDRQLFSLQSRFVTRNIRGGEREQVLPVPYSLDPLPFNRPETRPFTVLGRPVAARKHKQNLESHSGLHVAKYHIQSSQLTCNGPYYAYAQLIAGMVPVNLVHAIEGAGFDYNMSAKEVADAVVEGHQVLHQRQAVFRVHQ